MKDTQREQFIGHIDRVYKNLNNVARFVRANKIDLTNPLDVRMLNNLAVSARGLNEGIDQLLAPPLAAAKSGK